MSESPSILSLLERAQVHLKRRPVVSDPVGIEIQRVLLLLEQLPALRGQFPESSHPVLRHLKTAWKTGRPQTADLLQELRPVAEFLPWHYTYAKREDAPDLGQNIAFAEIIGPEAPFVSDTVCLGFTLIAPHTLYPAHQHPAIELYYVVAGTATWSAGREARQNPPGTFILHPSGVVHAMETQAEPLLALYTWSGADVRTTSSYSSADRSDSPGPH